jgi:hypothetical protein
MSSLAPHPSVVCTVLDEGGVLLHLDTKYYYSLNRTGMAVWSALEAGAADAGALARAAGIDANDPSAQDTLRSFLAELESASLVEAGAASSGPGEASPGAGLVVLDAIVAAGNGHAAAIAPAGEAPRLVRHDIPLNQILSNPFDPSVPLAE